MKKPDEAGQIRREPGRSGGSRADPEGAGKNGERRITVKPTTEKGYRGKIREACQGVETYREEFEPLIYRLADLYVRLEEVRKAWRKDGSQFYVTQVNKGGSEYYVKHPLLKEMDDTAEMVLELEKELGLTPQAIRKINESAIGKKKLPEDDPLAAALGKLKVI